MNEFLCEECGDLVESPYCPECGSPTVEVFTCMGCGINATELSPDDLCEGCDEDDA